MRLSRRERIAVAGMLALLIVALVYVLLVRPLTARLARLDRQIIAKEQELGKVMALRAEWNMMKAGREELSRKLKARGKDFSLFSYLEVLADGVGIKGNIEYMKPHALAEPEAAGQVTFFKKTGIDMKLARVTIDQVAHYLYQLESSNKVLIVERLELRPKYTNPQELSVSMQIVTLESL
ncbi:MAG: type II secretion system protein M [Deltaproteobacteria bacterium]|nr:type II secretion system protein M [Deltaproteobacteria bacterium]